MRESKILKGISYILIPVFILIIALSLFYELAKDAYTSKENYTAYFKSDNFLMEYMGMVSDHARSLIYENKRYNSIYDGSIKICYNQDEYLYYRRIKDYYYIILYKDLAITNVELTNNTGTVEGIKNYIINQDGQKANIVNGKVEASSELISNKCIQYFEYFKHNYYTTNTNEIIPSSGEENVVVYNSSPEKMYIEESDGTFTEMRKWYSTKIQDFQIYTTYKEEIVERDDELFYKKLIEDLKKYEPQMIYIIPVSSILLILLIIYLISGIGHSKGKEGIDFNDIDRIPIEFVLGVCGGLVCLIMCFIVSYLDSLNIEYYDLTISLFLTGYFISYILCAITLVTIIKRIKAKNLIKESITGKICGWLFKITKNIIIKLKNIVEKFYKSIKEMLNSWPEILKIGIYIVLYLLIAVVLIAAMKIIGLFIAIGIAGIYLYKFFENVNSYKKIEKHLKEMYEGNNIKKLDEKDFTKEFKEIVKYINDISVGFENAIEEGIKSERLKTELITNVSHDIKTPLTSIINYVDLLKKENIEDKKVKEYIEVLDSKSQRLKKLTEDLVEASKASSGNVKLNIEKININELIKQSTGEFEDKFKQKNLDIILGISGEELFINADNRYMYRIIENLFSNISKYALESSRVYIDVKRIGKKVQISIKNISKERLNISSDELIQRFVRGDKSRTTEGSGLGISISKSLTELQKGEFNLQIDGDLFKVELEFELI